jgi:hypothetical protein
VGPVGPQGPVSVGSASSSAGGSKTPTIKVDSKGRIVVSLRNSDKQTLRIRVQAKATIGGKKVTLVTRTVSIKGGHSSKVTLAVSAKMRKRLGHNAHPLTVTATPLTGSKRTASTMTAKIAIAG